MLTQRVASTHLWPGKQVVSKWAGLGIPGAQIPTTGDFGGSPLANDGIVSDNEYRIEVTTPPSAGTQTFYPDTSFDFTAPDGSYSFTYEGFENGFSYGSVTDPLTIGITAETNISATIGFITSSFSALSKPISTVNATISPLIFIGGSEPGDVVAGLIHATLSNLQNSFASFAKPATQIGGTFDQLIASVVSYSSPISVISATINQITCDTSSVGAEAGSCNLAATIGLMTANANSFVSPITSFNSVIASLVFNGFSYPDGSYNQSLYRLYHVSPENRFFDVAIEDRDFTIKFDSNSISV